VGRWGGGEIWEEGRKVRGVGRGGGEGGERGEKRGDGSEGRGEGMVGRWRWERKGGRRRKDRESKEEEWRGEGIMEWKGGEGGKRGWREDER